MSDTGSGFGLADDPIVQAKNKIIQTAEAVSTQSRELADILATAGAGWTGVGASGFTKAQIALNEDHDVIRRKLRTLLEGVSQTKNLSNANDEEVRAAFGAIQPMGASGNTSGLNNL